MFHDMMKKAAKVENFGLLTSTKHHQKYSFKNSFVSTQILKNNQILRRIKLVDGLHRPEYFAILIGPAIKEPSKCSLAKSHGIEFRLLR